jgi:hypothetical protein
MPEISPEPVAVGALAIDCKDLASFIVDLPPGGMRGFLHEQEGFADAIAEILANQPLMGEAVGITKSDIERLTLLNKRVAMIDARLPAVQKLLELLLETRATLDTQRQRQVHAIAGLIEGRARSLGDQSLLAKYEKTRAYRSAVGLKAAKTRRKNAQIESKPPVV